MTNIIAAPKMLALEPKWAWKITDRLRSSAYLLGKISINRKKNLKDLYSDFVFLVL